ncbi:PREDICTED: vacuolar protein sorting-associated protein 32 homolog 1 [Theobroma cacao]|uniref:Vacuolar protein sorting-associated protein 32 homolog 1 n=1 Tax=Theobroma cacao TaxID=3641 RepID=A0AB32WW50_THECC|nr:PREDICTED: vacuolar protein sorting-associated protein 32 homolog 1 [Theobroma cacao]
METLANYQLSIHDQEHKRDLDKTMDEIDEQTEEHDETVPGDIVSTKLVQLLIMMRYCFVQDELEAELGEHEGAYLEEQASPGGHSCPCTSCICPMYQLMKSTSLLLYRQG